MVGLDASSSSSSSGHRHLSLAMPGNLGECFSTWWNSKRILKWREKEAEIEKEGGSATELERKSMDWYYFGWKGKDGREGEGLFEIWIYYISPFLRYIPLFSLFLALPLIFESYAFNKKTQGGDWRGDCVWADF